MMNDASDQQTEDHIERNFTALGDFLAAAIADTSLLDGIPQGATLLFAPDDDPVTTAENERFAAEAERRGHPVHLVRFAHSAPGRKLRSSR